MSRKSMLFAIVALVLAAGAGTGLASQEGLVAANMVSQSAYIDLLDNWLYTHTGDNRGVDGPEHDLCMANIEYLMESYGLTVTLEPVNYYGSTYYNVVGKKLGTVYPDQEYVIGAHYDSVNNPGADDNASGVALVLTAAQIVTQYDSDYSITFIAFTREEQGLYGSEAYVAAHASDDIVGMWSADMVAFDLGSNESRVYTQDGDEAFRDSLGAAIGEYGDGLGWFDAGYIPNSDHDPFVDAGIPAGLLIEGEVFDNPYYHQPEDNFEQPGNLNFPFAVRNVRSMVGWLVDQAGVQVPIDSVGFEYPDGLPELVSPAGGTTVLVDVVGLGAESPEPGTGMFHFDVGAGWQAVPMDEISPDRYEAVFPASTCGETVSYYFSVEGTSSEVYFDPWQAPGSTYSVMAVYEFSTIFEETLDSDPGWTTEGAWAFGQPTGDGGDHGNEDPTSGYTGPNVYGYNLAGDYGHSLSETHLTSPAIDCSDGLSTELRFWRWLGVEQPDYDHAYLRISIDGANWDTIWENGAEVADEEWTEMVYDISTYADGESTVYLRWTMGETDGSWAYCGWNIDDISITGFDCQAPAGDGDYDDDGDVDLEDAAWFTFCFNGEGNHFPAEIGCEVFNSDGDIDIDLDDYYAFQESLLTGP